MESENSFKGNMYKSMYTKFIIIHVACAIAVSICISLAISLSGLSAPVKVRCDCGGDGTKEPTTDTNNEKDNAATPSPSDLPKDCQEVYTRYKMQDSSFEHLEDVYEIDPSGIKRTRARCVLDSTTGSGWTVIQRRVNGSVSFQRTWEEYKFGFGDPRGNVWLGNEYVHQLTSLKAYKLKVVIQDWDNKELVANYDTFSISSEDEKYKLTVHYMGGSLGDSLTARHNGRKFSTLDQDNDDWSLHCSAVHGGGGWWFGDCHTAYLNGLYCYNGHPYTSSSSSYTEFRCGDDAMDWNAYKNRYSLKNTIMLIAPN